MVKINHFCSHQQQLLATYLCVSGKLLPLYHSHDVTVVHNLKEAIPYGTSGSCAEEKCVLSVPQAQSETSSCHTVEGYLRKH